MSIQNVTFRCAPILHTYNFKITIHFCYSATAAFTNVNKTFVPHLSTEHTAQIIRNTTWFSSSCFKCLNVICLSSQRLFISWSNGRTESIISESHSVLVSSSVENSQHASPAGPRGRLNGIGGPRECNSFLRHARETPDSYRDSPHSERYWHTLILAPVTGEWKGHHCLKILFGIIQSFRRTESYGPQQTSSFSVSGQPTGRNRCLHHWTLRSCNS